MRWIRTAWTDERLDDLNGRVDELSRRMDAGFARVDAELRALSGRIDGLQHTLVAMCIAMVTGFVGLAGLIIAQT